MEREEAEERRRGRPIVVPSGGASASDYVSHNYEVRNGGSAIITELTLWIETVEGRVVSTRAGGLLTLAPNENAHMTVEVRPPRSDEQRLMVRWRDADGEHTEPNRHPTAAEARRMTTAPRVRTTLARQSSASSLARCQRVQIAVG
jgi:hypothetical protein